MNSKDETTKVDATELRRNRKMAIIIGTCAIIALISIVYGFVQQVAAEKNAMEALWQEVRVKELKNQLDECIRSQK